MDYDFEIYKRENIPYEDWSRIERDNSYVYGSPEKEAEPEDNEDCFDDNE